MIEPENDENFDYSRATSDKESPGAGPPEHRQERHELESEEPLPLPAATKSTRRLIDEIIRYVRQRQLAQAEGAPHGDRPDDKRLIRMALHQLRRHPVPTALLGLSVTWLLFAEGDEEPEAPSPRRTTGVSREDELELEWSGEEGAETFGDRVEEEVAAQVEGGFDYSRQNIEKVVRRYPWAAAATVVGAGLLGALLLPDRRRPRQERPETAHEEDPDNADGEGI